MKPKLNYCCSIKVSVDGNSHGSFAQKKTFADQKDNFILFYSPVSSVFGNFGDLWNRIYIQTNVKTKTEAAFSKL